MWLWMYLDCIKIASQWDVCCLVFPQEMYCVVNVRITLTLYNPPIPHNTVDFQTVVFIVIEILHFLFSCLFRRKETLLLYLMSEQMTLILKRHQSL